MIMSFKDKKVITIVSIAIVSFIALNLVLVMFFSNDTGSSHSENEVQENLESQVMRVNEALKNNYVVYYSTLVYQEEGKEIEIENSYPKEDWVLKTGSPGETCFGAVLANCYWVPLNSGVVEKDKAKKITLALESTNIIEKGDVSVVQIGDRFEVRIDGISAIGDGGNGEVESVVKTIELYTTDYDIYYKGEKTFDKFYDSLPKGG
jgi:hypothetical protein